MTEGTIVGWLVREGSKIAKGQEILEIETTKVTNAVEASSDGILRRIVLAAGATGPVGALAGVIADSSATDGEIDAFIDRFTNRSLTSNADASEPPASRFVETGEGAIHVLELGPADGDSVIFLHGFGGDLSSWMFNQSSISESLHSIAVDLPGHGQSMTVAADATLASIIKPVSLVIDQLASGRIHLVSHSFGGAVAAELAEGLGRRLASATLISPVGLGKEMNRQFLLDFMSAERRKPLLSALEQLFQDPSRITSDMVEAILRYKRLEGIPEGLRAIAGLIADENGQRQDIRSKLAALDCPVAVIWGAQDRIVPVQAKAALPSNVALQVVDNVGHMAHMEAPGLVNEAILKLVSGA